MVQISSLKEFRNEGIHKKKSQIILCHTSREANEYLTSLKFRYNKKYSRIPHYLIKKDGEVIQLMDDVKYSSFFQDGKINKKGIIITLENLGWLERKPLSYDYINWNGSIYKGEVYEKKWRDYFFWDVYTENQMNSLEELTNGLCDSFGIERRCSGHNTKIDGIINFEGIVSRSNYETRFTDLSPSFNFERLLKKIEHEQIS